MPSTKKPRKQYKPRPALMLPMTYALPDSNRADLQVTPHMVLESFRLGSGTEVLWHTLAAAINTGSVLARSQSDEVKADMQRARDALLDVQKRGRDTGRWGLSGDQFRALGEGLTLTDEMQNASSRRQVRDAIDEVIRLAAE